MSSLYVIFILALSCFHACNGAKIPAQSVTFNPTNNTVNSASKKYLLDVVAKDPLDLLTSSIPATKKLCKRIVQSSFDSQLAPQRIVSSSSGLVYSAIVAFNQHHHLVIRPDDVWITILTQFSLYVGAHAEELRHLFVAHNGSKTLSITGFEIGSMAQEMGNLMQESIVDPTLHDFIMPNFTTTTETDRITASIVMMATLKVYFDYEFSFLCGIPTVTLLGERNDWVQLLKKIQKLPSFGNETADWYRLLVPILTRFVSAYDQPDSEDNKDFWRNIVKSEFVGCGSVDLSGWITAFCYFDRDGQSLGRNQYGLLLDGVHYPRIDKSGVSPAHAEVDVSVDDNSRKYKAVLVAGMVGIQIRDSGVGQVALDDDSENTCKTFNSEEKLSSAGGNGGKNDILQPVPGWWFFEKFTAEDAVNATADQTYKESYTKFL